MALYFIQVSVLLAIAYQDVSKRLVDLYLLLLFPVISLFTVFSTMNTLDIEHQITLKLYSIVLALFCASLIYLFFRMNHFKLKSLIGAADVIFIASLLIIFQIDHFLMIMIVSGLTGILHGLYLIGSKSSKQIPFCTHLALTTLVFQLAVEILPSFIPNINYHAI